MKNSIIHRDLIFRYVYDLSQDNIRQHRKTAIAITVQRVARIINSQIRKVVMRRPILALSPGPVLSSTRAMDSKRKGSTTFPWACHR